MALLALVGGATAWKLTRRSPYERRDDAAKSPLPALAKADIDEIEIAEAGKPAVVLKKDGSEWKVTAPVADRADQKNVDQAIETLTTFKLRDVIAEKPESYDKVGQKDSEVTKVVPKKGGTALVTMIVGKTGNVRVGDDPKVWSATGFKRFALVREAKMWRDRSIVAFEQDKADTIEVDYDGVKVAIKREAPPPPPAAPDGGPRPMTPPARWVLVAGQDKIGGQLDDNAAVNVAATLSRLEAADFPAEAAPDKTGLDKPRAAVTVTLADKTQKQLLLGNDDGQNTYVKLAGGDRVWLIHKYEAERIPASPANWRDKTIARIPRAEVKKLELQKGAERLAFERVDDKTFKAVVPADLGDLEQTRVSAILSTLETLRASRIIDQPDAKAFAAPAVVVNIVRKDGKTWKLTVGAKDAKLNEYPAQIAGDKETYALPEYVVANYLKAPAEFKKKSGS